MPRLAIAAAVLCAGLLGLTACTDPEGTAKPTEGPRTTTPTPEPSTSPPPTPEEEAAAAALATVEAYWEVSERAEQAPAARDWEPELRQYGDEAAAAANLGGIQFLLEGGLRQEGEHTIDPEVTSVDLTADPQPTIMVTACFDSTGAQTVYAETGEPTGLDPPPAIPRWELRVTVLQYPQLEGSPWLVHGLEPLTEQPC